jgi:hypothetical protein
MSDYLVSFLNIFTGLRKTIVMLLLMIIGVSFRVKGLLNGNEFVDLFKVTVVSYFGANSVEHFSSMVEAHLKSKSTVAVIDNDGDNK